MNRAPGAISRNDSSVPLFANKELAGRAPLKNSAKCRAGPFETCDEGAWDAGLIAALVVRIARNLAESIDDGFQR